MEGDLRAGGSAVCANNKKKGLKTKKTAMGN